MSESKNLPQLTESESAQDRQPCMDMGSSQEIPEWMANEFRNAHRPAMILVLKELNVFFQCLFCKKKTHTEKLKSIHHFWKKSLHFCYNRDMKRGICCNRRCEEDLDDYIQVSWRAVRISKQMENAR